MPETPDTRFTIPLPGGRVARVPLDVLEQYLSDKTECGHGVSSGSNDVIEHSMSVDATTGTAVWHTDWELGLCDYTDENGFPQQGYVWHRHPLGTEYTEVYQR